MLQVFEQSLFLFFKIPYHSCRGNSERRCAQVSLASLQLANLQSIAKCRIKFLFSQILMVNFAKNNHSVPVRSPVLQLSQHAPLVVRRPGQDFGEVQGLQTNKKPRIFFPGIPEFVFFLKRT